MPLKAEGEFALVWKYLEEALNRPNELTPDLIFYYLLVDTAAIEEAREKLTEHLPWFEQEAERHDHKLFQAVALRAKAVANRLDGKFKPARDHLEKAVTIFQDLDTKWQLGRIYFELGQLALAQNNPSDAKTHFEQAAECYQEMGAKPDLERARAAIKSLAS